jgi:hypothetical protein
MPIVDRGDRGYLRTNMPDCYTKLIRFEYEYRKAGYEYEYDKKHEQSIGPNCTIERF